MRVHGVDVASRVLISQSSRAKNVQCSQCIEIKAIIRTLGFVHFFIHSIKLVKKLAVTKAYLCILAKLFSNVKLYDI